MASIKTKMAVGVFVITGFGLAFVAIIWLGMSHYFEKGQLYLAYFDESVQGLGKDSPVKYRGVPIGRVVNVSVAPDGNLIEVEMKIESGLKADPNVVAQLKSVGITGIMFVELDLKSPGMPDLFPRLTFEPGHPVIATRPSDIKQIFDSFSQILDQIKDLDLPGIAARVKTLLESVDKTFAQARVAEVSETLHATLRRIEQLTNSKEWDRILAQAEAGTAGFEQFTRGAAQATEKIDQTIDLAKRFVEENSATATEAIAQLSRAIASAEALIEQGRSVISGQGPRLDQLQHQLSAAARNLERAGRNLDRLLEGAAQAPSQLIWGTPPPPRPVDGDPATADPGEKRFTR